MQRQVEGWLRIGSSAVLILAIGNPISAQTPPSVSAPATQTPVSKEGSAQDELDVGWTKPYGEAAQKKADLSIVDRPLDENLTRLELVRWLTKVFNLRPSPRQTMPLKDVARGTPDYNNVQAVLQAGVMPGFPGGVFKPNGDITRLEALAIFDRSLKLAALPRPLADSWLALYKDIGAVPTAGRDFIAAAAQAGLVINFPDAGKLGPDDVITRGEGAVMLYQTLVYQKKLAALDPPVAQLKVERPVIANIDIRPNGRVRTGELVTVSAQGTSGAQAKFDFGEIARGVAMNEGSPGQYSGTYRVTEKDGATNPAVAVRLERNGIDTRVQKIAKLQVGEPTIARDPDDEVPSAAPAGTRDPYGYGGTGTTARADSGRDPYGSPGRSPYDDPYTSGGRTTSQGSYDPYGFPQPPARNPTRRPGTVASVPSRRSGDLFNPVPPFDPAQRPPTIRIQQVSFDPVNRSLYTGDILTVSLVGDVGGKATFRILGYTAPIVMKEKSPGFYEGKVQIGRNINVPGGTIEVMLERSGQRTSRTIEAPVNISSNP